MLADDVACNPRNTFPGTIYANKGKQLDLYGSGVDSEEEGGVEGVEVDYRGYQVNVENFLRVLTGMFPFLFASISLILPHRRAPPTTYAPVKTPLIRRLEQHLCLLDGSWW